MPRARHLGWLLVKANFSKQKIDCFVNEESTVPFVIPPIVFKRLKFIGESSVGENEILVDIPA